MQAGHGGSSLQICGPSAALQWLEAAHKWNCEQQWWHLDWMSANFCCHTLPALQRHTVHLSPQLHTLLCFAVHMCRGPLLGVGHALSFPGSADYGQLGALSPGSTPAMLCWAPGSPCQQASLSPPSPPQLCLHQWLLRAAQALFPTPTLVPGHAVEWLHVTCWRDCQPGSAWHRLRRRAFPCACLPLLPVSRSLAAAFVQLPVAGELHLDWMTAKCFQTTAATFSCSLFGCKSEVWYQF